MTPIILNLPLNLASLRHSPILPIIALLLTLSSVFIFSDARGHGAHWRKPTAFMTIRFLPHTPAISLGYFVISLNS